MYTKLLWVGNVRLKLRPYRGAKRLGRGGKASAVMDEKDASDPKVWAATCFFVRKDARGGGVTGALLEAGEAWARKNGATRVEACPMEHEVKRSASGLFVGPKRIFDRAGYETVIERKPGRPLVRKQLKATKSSRGAKR